jgi:hypothetical protein
MRPSVALVRRIPYEWINHMDWDCENAEQLPSCMSATGADGPMRELVVCGLA